MDTCSGKYHKMQHLAERGKVLITREGVSVHHSGTKDTNKGTPKTARKDPNVKKNMDRKCKMCGVEKRTYFRS